MMSIVQMKSMLGKNWKQIIYIMKLIIWLKLVDRVKLYKNFSKLLKNQEYTLIEENTKLVKVKLKKRSQQIILKAQKC